MTRGRTFQRLCVGVSTVAAIVAVASAASGGTVTQTAVRPVIGKPAKVPAHPLSGKRFNVLFRVTRSDTDAPLTTGRMVCDPSVAGKVIRHAESFRGGKAHLSFVVPASAAGKLLTVRLTIKMGGESATRVATFRILRGTPLRSLSVGDASVVEGNTGGTMLSFPITLSGVEAQKVTVQYATADGTATAPADYVASSGTLTLTPGARTQAIAVAVVGDRAVEPNETLKVALSNPTNAKIAAGSATGTIIDDDARSGHYAGSTSQGLPIEFDVTADVMAVENLHIGFVMTCDVIGVNPYGKGLNINGGVGPIAPDLSFEYKGGSAPFSFAGKLIPPGNASGTFRWDTVSSQNVWGIPNLHCSTGDIIWTAS